MVEDPIPSRGFDWSFAPSYRSGALYDGPLGQGWDFSDNRRLWVATPRTIKEIQRSFPSAVVGDVVRHDGAIRADLYVKRPDGSFKSPNGFYTRLVKNPDGSFTERSSDGSSVQYGIPTATGMSHMTSRSDRDGNTMRYEYDTQGKLDFVTDTLGRPIDYMYDSLGRLTEIRDFMGRSMHYEYDTLGNLVAMTTPAVTGTPNGNDFPSGKTTRYVYSSGLTTERLNHNLIAIIAPNEVADGSMTPRVVYTYETNPASPNADRLKSQTMGGTNASGDPAGGTITYQYDTLASAPPGDVTTHVSRTTVIDRNGNRTEYEFNRQGNVLQAREFTNRDVRPSDPPFYEMRYEYSQDYQMLRQIMPGGNTVEYTYDSGNADRFQQGNNTSTEQLPDATRGGDQTFIQTTYTYEPIYNRVRTATEPRGNDPAYVPQNGGVQSADRYRTTYTYDYQEGTNFAALGAILGISAAEAAARLAAAGVPMGLGDVNGDGRTDQLDGHLIRVQYPTVNLLAGSNQAAVEGTTLQPIVELYAYNDFGQLTRMVDPEGNVDLYDYYSERDPNGDGTIDNPAGDPTTGGYLKQVTRDAVSAAGRDSGTNPAPTEIRTVYQYDAVGNVIRQVDGRGIATDYAYNQLNQVVQAVRAAAHDLIVPSPAEPVPLTDFQYLERYYYDFNGNVVLRQVEDRGNTSSVDGNLPAGELPAGVPGASNPDPAGGPAFVETIYQYDILDNQIQTVEEVMSSASGEFLRTRYRYDPNGNQVLVIQPEGTASSSVYDERDLLFQTTRGATAPPSLALRAPIDPVDYDMRGGLPSTMTYHYDLNRNLVETVDAEDTDGSAANNSDLGGTGDRARYIYDGFDRRTSVVDSVGNQTVNQYDPAGNVVRVASFGPVGGASPMSDGPDTLAMPVSSGGVIQPSNLVNSNLLAATESLYDELGRVFQTDRALFVNTIPTMRPPDVADGASDIGKGNLTPGDIGAIPGVVGVTILGRVSTRTEYDRLSRTTFMVEDDTNTSRNFYDGASRMIRTRDPEGNTVETAYDDNSNVIETREEDMPQASIPSEEFVTTYFYDGLDRLQRTVDNLGQTTDYRYDSRGNLVAMADPQGPLTGTMISRRAFGPCFAPACRSLTVNAINDFGNVTRYFYDGLGRQIRQEVILTSLLLSTGDTFSGDGVHVGASIFGVKDDPTAPESFTPTADLAQAGGDGIIRTGFTYDRSSLSSALVDDQGNVTVYLYDNLDRRVTETKGLSVATTPLDKAKILGPREIVTPTAATINSPGVIPAARIDAQLAAAKARLDATAPLFPSLADRVDDHPPTTVAYGYDRDSDLLILEDENDSETFSRYDAIDRVIATRVFRSEGNPASQPADSFTGDPIFAPAPASDPKNPSTTLPAVIGSTKHDYQYDGLSRLVRATDDNDPAPAASTDDSLVTYAYDSLNRVIEETQQIGSLSARVVDSAWRAENLRSRLTYPNDRVLDYRYDGLDRLQTVRDLGAAQAIADYDYIGTYRVLVRSYPQNGTRMTYMDNAGTADIGYDGLRRPIKLRHLRSDNSLVVGFTHTYDRMNNKLTEGKLHDPTNSEVYSYDSTYRLIDFDRPAAGSLAPLHSDWSLDGVGNWSSVVSTETGPATTETREHSSFNEITTRTPGGDPATSILSDDNGNETDDGTFLFRWDSQNRLRTVTRKSDGHLIATYSYDSTDRRVRKVVTNSGAIDGTTDFYLDGSQEIEERNAAEALNQQYVFGVYIDEPLVMDRNLDGDDSATGAGDQRLFYHQNALYSVYALTETTNKIIEGYQYDAYGRQTVFDPGPGGSVVFGAGDVVTRGGVSQVGNPFLFTGRRLDGETRLYYYRARYLDAVQGRLIQRDPLDFAQRSASLYSYASNRPTGATDPLGLREKEKPSGRGRGAATSPDPTGGNGVVTKIPASRCPGYCGPDITDELKYLRRQVFDAWRNANVAQRAAACNPIGQMAWAVSELSPGSSLTQGQCPSSTPYTSCRGTVWMFGACVDYHEAQYFLGGVIWNLCSLLTTGRVTEYPRQDAFSPIPTVVIGIYKAAFYRDLLPPNTLWAFDVGYYGRTEDGGAGSANRPRHQYQCKYCAEYRGSLTWMWGVPDLPGYPLFKNSTALSGGGSF